MFHTVYILFAFTSFILVSGHPIEESKLRKSSSIASIKDQDREYNGGIDKNGLFHNIRLDGDTEDDMNDKEDDYSGDDDSDNDKGGTKTDKGFPSNYTPHVYPFTLRYNLILL